MEKQVLILFAGARGYLDKYPIDVLAKYEAGLHQFMEDRFSSVMKDLAEKKEITDELENQLRAALDAYDEEFKDTIK